MLMLVRILHVFHLRFIHPWILEEALSTRHWMKMMMAMMVTIMLSSSILTTIPKHHRLEWLVSKRYIYDCLSHAEHGVQHSQVLGRVLFQVAGHRLLVLCRQRASEMAPQAKAPDAKPSHLGSDTQDPHDGTRELNPKSCPLIAPPQNKMVGGEWIISPGSSY